MIKKYKGGLQALATLACLGMASPSLAFLPLTDANISNEYIVTSMPLTKSPGCPLVGSIFFLPGGILKGNFITDMARSKFKSFKGNYSLTNGKDITFTADSGVPLANLNGTIARSIPPADKRNPPVEYLIITTATAACSNEKYKLTLTADEE